MNTKQTAKNNKPKTTYTASYTELGYYKKAKDIREMTGWSGGRVKSKIWPGYGSDLTWTTTDKNTFNEWKKGMINEYGKDHGITFKVNRPKTQKMPVTKNNPNIIKKDK